MQEEVLGTTRTTPRLRLAQARKLEVSDDVLSLRFSPDARYLAVALLDNTVKVFFADSLKLSDASASIKRRSKFALLSGGRYIEMLIRFLDSALSMWRNWGPSNISFTGFWYKYLKFCTER